MGGMRFSDGSASLVSALLGAGLAVGLVYGGHALLAEADTDPDSPSASDVADGDVCDLMEEMMAYAIQFVDAQERSTTLLNDSTTDEATAMAAIHDIGEAILEWSERIPEYLRAAAEIVDDSEMATAFEKIADAEEEMYRIQGQAMIDAGSVTEYGKAVMDMAFDDGFLDLVEKDALSTSIAQPYVLAVCGVDIITGESDADASLKGKAVALGEAVAAYFLDWDGTTLPEITEAGGNYYLDMDYVAPQSEGIVLSDQWAVDAADWCVEVALEDDLTVVFSYSARQGPSQAACASPGSSADPS